jgi:hypothetical protein
MIDPSPRDAAPWIERLARVGYVAKAVLYITIGFLASQAGLGRGGQTTDTQGALRVVYNVTLGRVLLLVVAAGLMGYAIWRLVEAVVDPERRGRDFKGLGLRAGFAVRGLFHAGLAITAFRLALGERSSAGGNQTRRWTARAFDLPGGELLVWLAAIGIMAYGTYQFYRAYAAKMGQLDLSQISASLRRWVVVVSRFGLAARGVVFCLIGVFLARAAFKHDAGQVGGLRESLRTLAGLGRWPFVVVAVGLVAYGIYELVNARYRRFRAA